MHLQRLQAAVHHSNVILPVLVVVCSVLALVLYQTENDDTTLHVLNTLIDTRFQRAYHYQNLNAKYCANRINNLTIQISCLWLQIYTQDTHPISR